MASGETKNPQIDADQELSAAAFARVASVEPTANGRSIRLDRIIVRNRLRPVRAAAVEAKRVSMRETGQISPIKVRPDAERIGWYVLVLGAHRVAAATLAHADRDRTGLFPLRVCNLDGHTCDIFVDWGDGKASKPQMVAVQDVYSGMWLAARFDRTLNQHQVRLAVADTIRDHGLPHRLIMDNGSENQAKALAGQIPRLRGKAVEEEPAGLFVQLGIDAIFAKPRHGQAKPIERMFRDIAHNIASTSRSMWRQRDALRNLVPEAGLAILRTELDQVHVAIQGAVQ